MFAACSDRGSAPSGAGAGVEATIHPSTQSLLALPYRILDPTGSERSAASIDLLPSAQLVGDLQVLEHGDSLEVFSTGTPHAQIVLPLPDGLDPLRLQSLEVEAACSSKLRLRLGWNRGSLTRSEDAREELHLEGDFRAVHQRMDLDAELVDGPPLRALILSLPDPLIGTLRLRVARLWIENGAARGRASVDGVIEDALAVESAQRVQWELQLPAAGGRLEFDTAVRPQKSRAGGDGTGFVVELAPAAAEGAATTETIAEFWLHPGLRAPDRGWQARSVDLGPWAGRTIRLSLRATAGRPARGPFAADSEVGDDGALFGVPRLVRRKAESNAPGPANVLWIVVDTLRRDALGIYGAREEGLTPAIDRYARESIVFDRAWSASSWTHPSVGSMQTGWLPHRHGLGWGRLGTTRLAADAPSVAAAFARAGYRTYANSQNSIVSPADGFLRGFETFDAHTLDPTQESQQFYGAQRLVRSALRWIEGHDASPFFAYLHFFDPHTSYQAPAPYTQRFVRPAFLQRRWPSGMRAGRPRTLREQLERNPHASLPPGTAAYLRELYLGEVAYLDAWIGRLLDTLDARGVLDHTWVVFTSDHGEEFLEHGQLKHGQSLYEELVRMPLWIRPPGGRATGVRVEAAVSTLDLPATLLDLAGLPPLGADAASRSFRTILADPEGEPNGREVVPLEAVSTLGDGQDLQRALVAWPYKLFDRTSRDSVELYRLDLDPHERDDRSAAERSRARALRASWRRLAGRDSTTIDASAPVDPAQLERLKALGYVH